MNFYKFNCFANHSVQYGEFWAIDRHDVERHVLETFPNATGIYIFLAGE